MPTGTNIIEVKYKHPYLGKHTRWEPNIHYALSRHRSIISQYKKSTGRHVECAKEECKKESKFSIVVIDSAGLRRFITTTCCADHLDAAQKFFDGKRFTISEIL